MGNLLTRKQVADKFNISPKTVDLWSKKKILTPLRAGDETRTVRFSEKEVNKIFQKQNQS